jgi:hypothetical protein
MPVSKAMGRVASSWTPRYLDWVPTIQDISSQIRKMELSKTSAVAIGYGLVTLTLAGLVFFIFYADSKHDMPQSPPEEEMTPEQMKAMGLGDDDFDYEQLVNQRRELDEALILKGSTDKYDWQQSKTEVEVWMPLPEGLRSKDIKVDVRGSRLSVDFAGTEYLNGEFYDQVIPGECNWQIDTETETRRLWLTLLKKNPSARNQFWQSMLIGDAKVDVRPLGPSMVAIDPNDPTSFKDAIAQVKSSATAARRAADAEVKKGQ